MLPVLQELPPQDAQEVLLQLRARPAAAMHRVPSSPQSAALLVMEAESVSAEELSSVGRSGHQVLLQ